CLEQRLDPFAHGNRLSCEFRTEGGAHTTGSRRIQVTYAQVAFDDRPQGLPFRRGPGDFLHASSRFIERPCDGFDKQVILALKMPVEPTFFQAYSLHYRADPTTVPAALAEGPGGHRENLLVAPGFVFR